MTRFQKELSGEFGLYWKKEAQKELERVKADLQAGKITIENGVARNCIGRVLMSDMLEKLAMVTDKASVEATTAAARDKEVSESLAEYRKSARPATGEERMEMQAAFGKGTTVVNILTGEKTKL